MISYAVFCLKKKTRKWENAVCGVFTDTLATQQLQVRNLINEKRLDTMVNKLYSALNRALDLACPKTTTKIVDKNNPWWADKHQEARRQLNKLYKKNNISPVREAHLNTKMQRLNMQNYVEFLKKRTGVNLKRKRTT